MINKKENLNYFAVIPQVLNAVRNFITKKPGSCPADLLVFINEIIMVGKPDEVQVTFLDGAGVVKLDITDESLCDISVYASRLTEITLGDLWEYYDRWKESAPYSIDWEVGVMPKGD